MAARCRWKSLRKGRQVKQGSSSFFPTRAACFLSCFQDLVEEALRKARAGIGRYVDPEAVAAFRQPRHVISLLRGATGKRTHVGRSASPDDVSVGISKTCELLVGHDHRASAFLVCAILAAAVARVSRLRPGPSSSSAPRARSLCHRGPGSRRSGRRRRCRRASGWARPSRSRAR